MVFFYEKIYNFILFLHTLDINIMLKKGKCYMTEPNFKFNWGAFMYPLHFGFATKSWLCFLALIPGCFFIFQILAGFCAPKWAYDNGHFNTVEEFNAVMDTWDRMGKFTFILMLIATSLVFAEIFFFFFSIKEISNEVISEVPNFQTM